MFYNMTVKQRSAYCLYLLFLSFCQTGLLSVIVNIVVLKNKGLYTFVFNDNSDND